jgi:hypothetical protein
MSVRSWWVLGAVSALVATGQGLVAAAPSEAARVSQATARAGESWSPVKVLTANPRGESLAVDARGWTTVVWANWSVPHDVVAVRRAPGGRWTEPVVIGHGYGPVVATDTPGDVTVAWITQRRDYTDGVATVRHPAAGQWSSPTILSRHLPATGYIPNGEGPYGAATVSMAVSPRGATVVAWDWGSDDRSVPWRIRSAFRPAGGGWGVSCDVTPANGAAVPQVGIGNRGNVMLVCGRTPPGQTQVLMSRRRVVGSGWTDATVVGRGWYMPSLEVDRNGNAVVAAYTSHFNRVRAIARPASGTWGTPRLLSAAGVDVESFALAMNPRGSSLVAMSCGAFDHGRVVVLRRPAGGSWSGVVRVARTPSVAATVLGGLNGHGDAFVGWGTYTLSGVYRPHGGSWSGPLTILPDSPASEVLERAHAVVSPLGGVAVLWKQEDRRLKARWMTASTH